MRKFGLLLMSLLAVASGFAQQVSGNVKDQQGKAISGSTVSLLNAKDSLVVKLAVSNSSGHYSFNPVKQGKYVVSITHVGYARTYFPAFYFSGSGEINSPSLELNK